MTDALEDEKNKLVTSLNPEEAREFFLKEESYCSIDLPPYLGFEQVLSSVAAKLDGKLLSDFQKQAPREHENLNYTIFCNKDGKFAWRPLELIHPVIYVSLVHKVTEEKKWKTICDSFSVFSKNKKIKCLSIPVVSLTEEKDKAEQVSLWWREVELQSIELALDFEYLAQTDITDCYGSIYTHSFSWALHGKSKAKLKKNQSKKSWIGNIIDWHIQDMCHGQTNGIPQGSVLMDFLAEIILGYADVELTNKISHISDYQILRYRDDYRIFVNNPQDGDAIIKALTEVMIGLGMKINPSKTAVTNTVVKSSVKPGKIYWAEKSTKGVSLLKYLLMLHELSCDYPNSGSLISAMNAFFKQISKSKKVRENILSLVSVVADIALQSPKTYPVATAIISKLFSFIEKQEEKEALLKRIKNKFTKIPNTGYLDIWLQRVSISFDVTQNYNEPLCKIVMGETPEIWNNAWLKDGLAELLSSNKIVCKITELPPVIAKEEIELFITQEHDS